MTWLVLLLAAWFSAGQPAPRALLLTNDRLAATFGTRGLVALTDRTLGWTIRIPADDFAVVIDGTTYDSRSLPAPVRRAERDRVTYAFTAGPHRLDLVYELRPDWAFVSKQVLVAPAGAAAFRVEEVTLFRTSLLDPIAEVVLPPSARPSLGTGVYGAALRMDAARGLLAVVQNPFLQFRREANGFSLGYRPDMTWPAERGPFASDRGLLAPYRLTGRRLPAQMLPEWQLGPNPAPLGLDEAEIATFTNLVRTFLLYRPQKPIRVFVGWCANDYQIDVATPEGRAEYRRLLDRAAELGADYVLYAPTHSQLARRIESEDDWSWEHVLWLGLGQKIRKGEWDPRTDPVPGSVQEMLDAARAKGLKLLAYVYPVVPFSQDPSWLAKDRRDPSRRRANLAAPRLQDWLIDTLVAFHARTGVGGYAFDHTFLTYDGASPYAQWWGWRRVMEELRRRLPDIVIDGRQAYHLYGPWSWLAGSYPHPTFHDEQPESFVPFPDLHIDRVSADRERYTAYRYRNYEFAPSELVPGFITHQTPRHDDAGAMPQAKTDDDVRLVRFRARDWDYLGWRYSLISSIAVAGWNHVLNMIPARDPEEYGHFSDADRHFFRRWLDWATEHREALRHTRTILGQPALGRVDGTSAIVADRGFVFLFNPNARRLRAEFSLDESIGLAKPAADESARRPSSRPQTPPVLLRELYPVEGRAVGKPLAGLWSWGDRVSIPMDGGSALVLAVEPVPTAPEPMLFNAPGTASLADGVLRLDGVTGEMGTSTDLLVRLPVAAPAGAPDAGVSAVRAVFVNGREMPFSHPAPGLVSVSARFDGERFGRLEPVGAVPPDFAGGRLTASFSVPARVIEQLAARARAWPIPWTAEDYRTPWLAPERLLLFVQIAEPDPQWEIRLAIDGRPVEVRKAYSAVRPAARTFVGFYADLSLIAPDRTHTVVLELPPLRPGQFQGMFFENVEPEYTGRVEPVR